jgi:hypothetical protein
MTGTVQHRSTDVRSNVEAAIDAVLSDSFPASDPPPWTLGVRNEAAKARGAGGNRGPIVRFSSVRTAAPAWWQVIVSFFAASIVSVAFAVVILVLGSVLALSVRLLFEVVAAAVNFVQAS